MGDRDGANAIQTHVHTSHIPCMIQCMHIYIYYIYIDICMCVYVKNINE